MKLVDPLKGFSVQVYDVQQGIRTRAMGLTISGATPLSFFSSPSESDLYPPPFSSPLHKCSAMHSTGGFREKQCGGKPNNFSGAHPSASALTSCDAPPRASAAAPFVLCSSCFSAASCITSSMMCRGCVSGC